MTNVKFTPRKRENAEKCFRVGNFMKFLNAKSPVRFSRFLTSQRENDYWISSFAFRTSQREKFMLII